MKILLILITTLALIVLCYFIFLAWRSHTGSARGLINSQLSPCPASPNCICTEYPDDTTHYAEAIKYTTDNTAEIVQAIETAIIQSGGKITRTANKKQNYLSATYTTTLFRYVDDFEVRLDTDRQLIHIRSASRVGKSDFGANLKRINVFKEMLVL